jgi:hypothetical protein
MQSFVPKAPVVLVWTTIPYRMEWRYMEAAHRVIALDAGHACQNLYLAVQAVGCGTCAVAAFHQQALDEFWAWTARTSSPSTSPRGQGLMPYALALWCSSCSSPDRACGPATCWSVMAGTNTFPGPASTWRGFWFAT